MTLGKLFKDKREAAGLTQKELANKLGLSTYQHVSNLERGVLCSPAFAVKVCNILKIPREDVYKLYLKIKTEKFKKEFGL